MPPKQLSSRVTAENHVQQPILHARGVLRVYLDEFLFSICVTVFFLLVCGVFAGASYLLIGHEIMDNLGI